MVPMHYNRRAASEYLAASGIPVAAATLATWAVYGKGPKFSKVGRTPMYSADELDGWANAQLAFAANSTTAHDNAKHGGGRTNN